MKKEMIGVSFGWNWMYTSIGDNKFHFISYTANETK
jgi:hypothetical protein